MKGRLHVSKGERRLWTKVAFCKSNGLTGPVGSLISTAHGPTIELAAPLSYLLIFSLYACASCLQLTVTSRKLAGATERIVLLTGKAHAFL